MASDPYLRQVPERLRVLASVLKRGPVRLPLLAFLDSITCFPRLLAASQLARLSHEKATPHAVFLTKAGGPPQGRRAFVGKPSCIPKASVA